jgi:hypothetical protein
LFPAFPVTGPALIDLALALVMTHDPYVSRSYPDKSAPAGERMNI